MTETTKKKTGRQRLHEGDVLQDRYVIRGVLGAGGFAVVYEGHDETIDRPVAVKVLNLHMALGSSDQTRQVLDRFRREARLAARIRHPSIIEIYDYGVLEPGDHPYMVMEFLEGSDLEHELIENGPMEPARLFPLFCDALDALDEAHDEGVIHKDLKPANLFLSRPGTRKERMKLVDFGIAHANSPGEKRMTKTGLMTGTPQYLSPEYVEEQKVGPAMDIYQMGLILVEALTGRPCVDDSSPFQAAFKHVQRDLDIPKQLLKGEFGDILDRALAYDPEDRYTRASDFADALAAIDPGSIPSIELSDAPRSPGPVSPVPDTDAFVGQNEPDSSNAFDETLSDFGGEARLGDGEDEESFSASGAAQAREESPQGGPVDEKEQSLIAKTDSRATRLDLVRTEQQDHRTRIPLILVALLGAITLAVLVLAVLLFTDDDDPTAEEEGAAALLHPQDQEEADQDDRDDGEDDPQDQEELIAIEDDDDSDDVENEEGEVEPVIVELTTTPERVTVKSEDGDELGTTPLELEFSPDEVLAISLHRDGYRSQELQIDADSKEELHVELVRRAPPSKSDPPPPQPESPRPITSAPSGTDKPADDVKEPPEKEEEEESPRQMQLVP